MKFRGDRARLKKCVTRTGLDGRWRKLLDGQRQYLTRAGGILNWSPTTGTVWFQGDRCAAQKLKLAFEVAAKNRIDQGRQTADRAPLDDVSALKGLLADALLTNDKLRRGRLR